MSPSGSITRILCQVIVTRNGLGWNREPLQVFGGRLVVPPSFGGEFVPTNQIRPSASLTQELDAPFVQHAVLIKVGGCHRIGIGILEIPNPYLVDKLGCTG